MPFLQWTSPTGQKWKVLSNNEFEGDILFTYYPSEKEWLEAFSFCPYIVKIVKEEYLNPEGRRRKELPLAARDIKGRPSTLHVPFELLLEVVAKGYVFPKLLKWLYEMDPKLLISFLPLARSDKTKRMLPKKMIEDCLLGIRKLSQRFYKQEREDRKDDDENPNSLRI